MKKFTGLFLSGLLLTGQVSAQGVQTPDLIIHSKLDYDWTGALIKKFRTLLTNFQVSDPFSARIDKSILVNESEVGSFLPADSKDLIKTFGEALGLNLINAETKVWMTGLEYDVKGFRTELKATEVQSDGLIMENEFSASEVYFSTDKLSLSLVIPGKNSSPVFTVDVVKPVVHANSDKLINFLTKIKVQDNKDSFKLRMLKASFDTMAKGLLRHADDIVLDYERLVIPEVSIKIGRKTVNFSPEKIARLLRDRHEAIKGILLAQLASTLRTNTIQAAFSVLEKYEIKKEHWIPSEEIASKIALSSLGASNDGNIIELNLPGDFCTNEKYNQHKKACISKKDTQTAASRLTGQHFRESKNIIKDLMDRGDANIVASVSEDYVNKLLVATYDAGLWKEALDEAGVTLGPNKVIMRLDKRGETGTVIMDVVYKAGGFERFMTGAKTIRFPLVLDIGIRIENRNGEPVLIVRLHDVDTSDQTLIHGRPADNIMSTIKDVSRFRGKVLKTIRQKVGTMKNKDMLELPYPDLKGAGLEKIDFLSDGKGRMNAYLRLEDIIEGQDS